ncbi:hypothetical protein C1645_818851 [Glomus cerebriforme]|uniref:Uncharacterized protein n=1 Tax=Glomus cerebriforme TaxID=658196 RepID=A0A397TC58_9GLOM|nr:hypothetical protein C1645_818851 [Glomus cerebriforme]
MNETQVEICTKKKHENLNETQVVICTNKEYEIFDILEIPDPKSQLIKSECSSSNDTNFENLTSNFSNLIDLIRLAENGAHRHCDIQIQIRDIGRIITRLAGDTTLAILAFERSSTEMAETWKLTIEYLHASFEEETLITLDGIEKIAKEMLDTSIRLKGDVNIASDKIKNISNAARKQKDKDVKNKEEIDAKKKELKIEESMWKKNEEIAQADIENLKLEINDKIEKIETTEKSINKFGIFNCIFPTSKTAKEIAENERKEKQRLIEEQRTQIAAYREANKKVREFSLRLLNCKDQLVLATDVVDSLNQAFSAINVIEGVIEAARIHWERTYMNLKKLSNQQFGELIRNYFKKDEKGKQDLFRSFVFKKNTIKTYVKCIAVSEICNRYKDQMEKNHNHLIKYLKENPSDEQSIAIVKYLAEKLNKNTEITDNRLSLEEKKLNEQEANLNDDIQANMELSLYAV